MPRRAVGALALCALLLAAYHFGASLGFRGFAADAVAPVDVVLAAAAVALVLALVAWQLRRRIDALEREVKHLSRSVEGLFRTVTERPRGRSPASPRATAKSAGTAQAPPTGGIRPAKQRAMPIEPARNDNVVVHPATLQHDAAPLALKQADAGETEPAQHVLAVSEPEIRLQPIVSMARGEAVAFETSIGAEATPDSRSLMERTIRIARQRLGSMSERLPVHVAVTDAFVADDANLAILRDDLARHAPLARSLVLSLSPAPASDPALLARKVASSIQADMTIAAGISAGQDDLEALRDAGVSVVKIPAALLLSGRGYAEAIVKEARDNGVTVVATGVGTDDDAMALIDLGIDLMCGDCFSAPWSLETEADVPAEQPVHS